MLLNVSFLTYSTVLIPWYQNKKKHVSENKLELICVILGTGWGSLQS